MRKRLICVLMMTLFLTGCGGGGGKEAEELALSIRGEYLAMESCAIQASVTADYGQRVYEYEMAVSVNGTETVLTLSAPETVAGLTARLAGEESQLEFDGLSVETGPLDGDGLTPVSAVPALLEAAPPAPWRRTGPSSGWTAAIPQAVPGRAWNTRCGSTPPPTPLQRAKYPWTDFA